MTKNATQHSNAPTGSSVHKVRKNRGRRFLRLLASILDPRAWAHLAKVVNFYNYSHVQEIRKATLGNGVNIAPTAGFANGQNVQIGDRTTISSYCQLWAGPSRARVVIGRDALIAPDVMMTATNYRYNDGAPIEDQAMDEAEIIVGDDVWVGRGVTVLAGARIGKGAVISANAVVAGVIPPYAIAVGSPARVIGYRRSPDVVAAPAQVGSTPAPQANVDVLALIRQELPALGDEQLQMPVTDAGVDSFDLITLRTVIETTLGRQIPDREWSGCDRLIDIPNLPSLAGSVLSLPNSVPAPDSARAVGTQTRGSTASVKPEGRAHREMALNMPQMALSGLGESWLFKELGDMHWAMITAFLETKSSAITDEVGDRLYATFTRILLEVEPSLRGFRENDDLAFASELERYGASFFLGQHRVDGPAAQARATTMSTFAKYGEHGQNTSLIKGAPLIRNPDAIPSLESFPEFGQAYRTRRSEQRTENLFECTYEILPPHDINGVGLLYFAAYPTIFDLCLERAEGKGFLAGHSTVSKDICYFANSDPDETLIFRLHAKNEAHGIVRHEGSIYRTGDGKRMAEIRSEKRVL